MKIENASVFILFKKKKLGLDRLGDFQLKHWYSSVQNIVKTPWMEGGPFFTAQCKDIIQMFQLLTIITALLIYFNVVFLLNKVS